MTIGGAAILEARHQDSGRSSDAPRRSESRTPRNDRSPRRLQRPHRHDGRSPRPKDRPNVHDYDESVARFVAELLGIERLGTSFGEGFHPFPAGGYRTQTLCSESRADLGGEKPKNVAKQSPISRVEEERGGVPGGSGNSRSLPIPGSGRGIQEAR